MLNLIDMTTTISSTMLANWMTAQSFHEPVPANQSQIRASPQDQESPESAKKMATERSGPGFSATRSQVEARRSNSRIDFSKGTGWVSGFKFQVSGVKPLPVPGWSFFRPGPGAAVQAGEAYP